ncbi:MULTISPECIES: copper chaperone PCu(A)C [unclassified Mycolicibacterium]|uniref:copper chaperone PCu(A)C n=1 Tax=unclassified Mycolicibacterium TaxID=2636767 RepID=UPI0012DF13F3|nr:MULTISPECIES: copper chaperone PCu(A)C [unclassified Mycolicibacterium]MUL83093.1 copper chaperone PCu(A)C [Mycolicibacterium sp. CBMA 329]MUL89428.1 copper chaperone PCu(A)C [Mycolicibacterium sp. CBMA 331]MUL99117.1 copper chaperone PCu(A)C [Mycolicibacterium sp. CBMA 334]MUM24743.1 copper chaperone PCu(A)C [Mycolicibacterium sp. CBMA 295]MUM38944.1 copper chaperone PCu(A)C [Mycolicibacterium sp. CBMA 247]
MSRAAVVLGAIVLALVPGVAGCTESHPDQKMADTVQVSEQWASAAESGMTAVFGTVTNTGHHDARIVSATSPAAGMVELHEVVSDGSGSKTMRPKEDGFSIPAGGTHDLAPGGDHLMLMDLTAPLQPGAEVPVTVVFEDGSSLPVTAQVRDFAGGNENYQAPSPHGHG